MEFIELPELMPVKRNDTKESGVAVALHFLPPGRYEVVVITNGTVANWNAEDCTLGNSSRRGKAKEDDSKESEGGQDGEKADGKSDAKSTPEA